MKQVFFGVLLIIALLTVSVIGEEIKTKEDVILNFYTGLLLRPEERVSQDEMDYWLGEFDSSKTGRDVVSRFLHSTEFKDRNTTDSEFVESLYFGALGRTHPPDLDSEVGFWVSKITNDSWSREQIMDGFIYSAEFENICRLIDVLPYEGFEGATIPPTDGQYHIETFGQVGSNVLVRATATDRYIWVGEYSLQRPDGYEHLDNKARLWYTTDGQTWYEGGSIDGYESINAITAMRDKSGINFGSEQSPKIFSTYDYDPSTIIHRFSPDDNRYDFALAIDDAGSFGELAVFNAPNANPETRLAGFFDGRWQWAPYPTIKYDFTGWDIIEWYDWLLVSGGSSIPSWTAGAGKVIGTKSGWNNWEIVSAPGGDIKGCMTLTKVGNTLIASFSKQIRWTTDPELKNWNKVNVPGYWNFKLIQTGPETVIGLWASSDRWSVPDGNGVWLVELNFITGTTRIIHKWDVDGKTNLPFYVGGDLAKLEGNTAIGFYSSGGKSYGIRITW